MPAINNPLCIIGEINRGQGPLLRPKQSNQLILKTLYERRKKTAAAKNEQKPQGSTQENGLGKKLAPRLGLAD